MKRLRWDDSLQAEHARECYEALSREERLAHIRYAVDYVKLECAAIVSTVPLEIWLHIVEFVEFAEVDSVFRLACVSHALHRAARVYIQQMMQHLRGKQNRVLRHFPGLTSLHIQRSMTGCISRDLLAAQTSLTQLKMGHNCYQLDDDALRNMHLLRDLTLKCSGDRLTAYGLKRKSMIHTLSLRDMPRLRNLALSNMRSLTSLELGSCMTSLTDGCLQSLWNLTHLSLPDNDFISDNGISHLLGLRSLNLAFNKRITDASVLRFTNLTALNIHYNSRITDASVQRLSALERLWLTCNDTITARALTQLTQLRTLCMYGRDGRDDGHTLCHLTSLNTLFLSEDSVISPAQWQCLRQLTRLVTRDSHNALSDGALQAMWPSLRHLTNYGFNMDKMITLEKWLNAVNEGTALQIKELSPCLTFRLICKEWLSQ